MLNEIREYPFPLRACPPQCPTLYYDWAKRLVECSSFDVLPAIMDSWLPTNSKGVETLSRLVLSGEPASLLVGKSLLWVRIKYHATNGKYELFLPPPDTREHVDATIERFSVTGQSQTTLRSFLLMFSGLQEVCPPHAGFFTRYPHAALAEYCSHLDPTAVEWTGLLPIFHSAYGDLLIVNTDGSTMWHVLETQQLIAFVPTIDEAITIYTRFKRETGGMFGFYEAMEFLRADSASQT